MLKAALLIAAVSLGSVNPTDRERGDSQRGIHGQTAQKAVAAIYQPSCISPANREDAEYCQEAKEAGAARDEVTLAIVGALIAAAGVAGVVATLYFTARAANAAKVASEALPILERAYVFLSPDIKVSFWFLQMDMGEPGEIAELRNTKIKFSFRNEGKTPAIITGSDTNIQYWEDGFPPHHGAPVSAPVGLIIGSGKKWTHPKRDFEITAAEFNRAGNGDGHIFLWGRICYNDIFVGTHETGYCWEYDFTLKQFIQSDNTAMNYQR